nr:MAG TPA: hypothetical protein [Caudoviricetes sp.]
MNIITPLPQYHIELRQDTPFRCLATPYLFFAYLA